MNIIDELLRLKRKYPNIEIGFDTDHMNGIAPIYVRVNYNYSKTGISGRASTYLTSTVDIDITINGLTKQLVNRIGKEGFKRQITTKKLREKYRSKYTWAQQQTLLKKLKEIHSKKPKIVKYEITGSMHYNMSSSL